MSKSIIRGLWVVMVIAIAAGAYVFGQWTERRDAAAYVYDVAAHISLSCSNEHLATLTDLRAGKTQDAVQGSELVVAARLEGIDVARIPDTTFAKKSLENLRTSLLAYQTRFPTTTLDPKKNPRLGNVMRTLK